MRTFDKALSNTFYLIASWAVMTPASFLFQLVALKLLTQEQFGISLTAINLSIFLGSILALGTYPALSKLIPEYKRKNNKGRIKSVVSKALLIILLSNFLFTIFLVWKINLFSAILKIPINALLISILSYFFYSLSLLFSAVVYGLQDMKRYFVGGVLYSITKVVVSTVLMLLGFSYFGPILGIFLGIVVWLLVYIMPKFVTFKIDTIKDRELFKYSIPGLVSTFANSLFANAQYVILTIIKTAAITGIFGVGMLISSVITVIPNILTLAVFPIISELSINKLGHNQQRRLVAFTIRYSLFLTVPIIFIFSIFSGFLILIFSNPDYLGASSLIPILSVAALLLGISGIFSSTIYATRRPATLRNILIIVSIFFLLITPILATLKGDFGMSISFLSAMILYLFLSFTFLKKKLKIDLPLKDAIKIIFASAVPFSFLFYLNDIISNVFVIIISIILSGLVYIIILWKLKFYKPEDVRVLKFFSKKYKFLRKPVDIASELIGNN